MTNPPRKDIHNSDIPALCQSCEARHKGMCSVLQPYELVTLSRHTRVVQKQAGVELMAESMPVESYANVMRGVVKLSKVLEDGRQQIGFDGTGLPTDPMTVTLAREGERVSVTVDMAGKVMVGG